MDPTFKTSGLNLGHAIATADLPALSSLPISIRPMSFQGVNARDSNTVGTLPHAVDLTHEISASDSNASPGLASRISSSERFGPDESTTYMPITEIQPTTKNKRTWTILAILTGAILVTALAITGLAVTALLLATAPISIPVAFAAFGGMATVLSVAFLVYSIYRAVKG